MRLRTILALVLAAALGSPALRAEEQQPADFDAKTVFVELPLAVTEILPRATRVEMVVYSENNGSFEATNALSGKSSLLKLTPDYAKVRLTDVSQLEIRMLPLKKGGKVAMIIYTIGDDETAGDSQLFFYDSDMNQLPTKRFITVPRVKAFFEIPKGSLTKMKEIEEMIPFPTVIYTMPEEGSTMTAELTSGKYMNVDDYNIVRLFLKPQITFSWDGRQFNPDK